MTANGPPTFQPMSATEARARIRSLESGIDLQAEEVAPGIWSIPSISQSDAAHLVFRHNGRLSCDCRGFAVRGICVHVASVLLILERQRPEPAPTAGTWPLPAGVLCDRCGFGPRFCRCARPAPKPAPAPRHQPRQQAALL